MDTTPLNPPLVSMLLGSIEEVFWKGVVMDGYDAEALDALEKRIKLLEKRVRYLEDENVYLNKKISERGIDNYVWGCDLAAEDADVSVVTTVNNGEVSLASYPEHCQNKNSIDQATAEEWYEADKLHRERLQQLPIYLDSAFDGPIGP